MPKHKGFLRRIEKAEKEEIFVILLSVAVAGGLFALNMLYIQRVPGLEFAFTIVNVLAGIVMIVPPTIVHYSRYKDVKTIEERFPDFLRNIVEGLRGGMTLPLAIEYASRNRYGALSPHVQRLVSQITWGIPFEKALDSFASATKSRIIARAVSTVIESHRSGGDIAEVLASVGVATMEIDKIKRERASRIYAQMSTGYIIFFIFVGVMIGMQKFLLPALSFGGMGAAAGGLGALNVQAYGSMFKNLAVIQGAFAGLSIGKMAEGTFSAGWKHAAVMALMGYTGLTLVG